MSLIPDAEQAAPDADLLGRLASGDRDALDVLYRRYEDYARRVAFAVSGGDPVVADDLMAEAFAAVFRRAAANAPISNFRAYLSACIRNAHLAHLRSEARSSAASDQPWLFDAAVDDPNLVYGVAEEHAMAALAALPVRWRELLWRIEVEGRTNAELADLMGKNQSAVSSMTHRAREGLRRAFLDRHVPAAHASACRWTRQHLSRYVRNDLSERAVGRVRSHVSECASCAGVLQELEAVNRRIGASLWPVVLVGSGPTLPAVSTSDGSSNQSPDVSSMSSASASAPPAGPLAVLAGASPVTIAAGVGVAAAVVIAAGALAMKLTGTENPPADRERPAAVAPGGAAVDDHGAPAPADAEPPPGQAALAAPPLSGAEAEEDKEDEEEKEDEDSPRRPTPNATTATPAPTYDASFASVDKSDVAPGDTAFEQSLAFAVQVTSAGPRSGTVLDLAITIDDPQFSVAQVSGSGWVCRIQPDGQDLEDYLGDTYVFDPGTTVICSYTFPDNDDPPDLEWDLAIADPDGVSGSASIAVVGRDDPNGGNDSATF